MKQSINFYNSNKKLFIGFCLLIALSSCSDSPDLNDPSVTIPAPSELKTEKLSTTSVKLLWKDNCDGEEGYAIERWATGATTPFKTTVGADVTEWTDNNLTEGTYRYRICAYYKKRTSDTISIYYQHVPINSPTNFKLAVGQNSVDLTWDVVKGGIDGYKIERKSATGAYVTWKTLPADATSVSDTDPIAGTSFYKLYAYSGNILSVGVEKTISIKRTPTITIGGLSTSYLKLSAYFTLTSDGGDDCNVGICWSKSENPTISDSKSVWHQKANSGNTFFGNATNLDANTTYYIRAYATNSLGTAYSSQIQGVLQAQPAAISLSWTPMSSINSALPSEIKVYSTTSPLNGRNFQAWYAIADMSTGNIELKTTLSTTAKTLSQFIAASTDETTYIMTNGGYFAYNGSNVVSYSLMVDRGSKKADNISALTRGDYTYPVTRGVFGVTAGQAPMIKWVAGNFSYDIPSPNVEGETPQISPSQTFPATSTNWNPYTAVGGAPILIKDGKVVFDFTTTSSGKYMTNYELLQTDIFSATIRPPRTLIGSTADNKIVLFVCDGRQTQSDGATLIELVQIMKSIGCINVLNLDGGGSSAMIVNNTLLNKPSDGSQRAVAAAVSFVKKK